jgi:hypothetical protein
MTRGLGDNQQYTVQVMDQSGFKKNESERPIHLSPVIKPGILKNAGMSPSSKI